MPNPQLRAELLTLQSKIAVSGTWLQTARRQASEPVQADVPMTALIHLAEAVAAQQEALVQIEKVLEKLA